jgi:hypothetical protein
MPGGRRTMPTRRRPARARWQRTLGVVTRPPGRGRRALIAPLRPVADRRLALVVPLRPVAGRRLAIVIPLRPVARRRPAFAIPLWPVARGRRAIAAPLWTAGAGPLAARRQRARGQWTGRDSTLDCCRRPRCARCAGWLVSTRPRRARGPAFLRAFLETRARILVFPARTPLAIPFLARPIEILVRPLRLFRRVPQLPAREPLQHHVRVLALQLHERRQEVFFFSRAKGRWLLVDQNGPVRKTRGHGAQNIMQSSALEPSKP